MTKLLFYRGVQTFQLEAQKRHRLLTEGREMQVHGQGIS